MVVILLFCGLLCVVGLLRIVGSMYLVTCGLLGLAVWLVSLC